MTVEIDWREPFTIAGHKCNATRRSNKTATQSQSREFTAFDSFNGTEMPAKIGRY